MVRMDFKLLYQGGRFMGVSNVGAASGYQYEPKAANALQEEVKKPDSEKRT